MLRLNFIALAMGLTAAGSAAAGTVPDSVVQDLDKGYSHRALAALEPLVKDHPQDADVQFHYGEALLNTGMTDDALAAMKAAVSLDPKNGIYHRGLGEAYGSAAQEAGLFSKFSLAKSALAEFQAAVQLAPQDVDGHADLATYYIQAPGIAGGSLDKAHAEEAVLAKLDPVRALLVQASEAQDNKDYGKTETLLKQAAALDKKTDSDLLLGAFYLDRQRFGEALDVFTSAAAMGSGNPTPDYFIGRAAGMGHLRYDDGIKALKEYLTQTELPDSAPKLAWAHLRLGDLYALRGDKDSARTEYATAEKLVAEEKLSKNDGERFADELKKSRKSLD